MSACTLDGVASMTTCRVGEHRPLCKPVASPSGTCSMLCCPDFAFIGHRGISVFSNFCQTCIAHKNA
eukprot:12967-Heterococcus_DN1.PRE.2